jgi:hypothetical protein
VTSLGVWKPLTPRQVANALAGLDAPWWIAGGMAIDAFLGHKSREHGDIDVGVLRRDQLAVQAALQGWDLQAADPPGTLRPWRQGETLPLSVHDIWCRPNLDAAWGLQLMLDEADGDTWEFRRNALITRPLQSLVWRKGGVPYLAPEVQLLYKAATQSPKNEADFRAALPKLNQYQRMWLTAALDVAHPSHPWIERLQRKSTGGHA